MTTEELGDSAFAARNVVEDDERERREASAFQARVRGFHAQPDSDLEHDYLHDTGEDEWRDEE